MRFLGGLVVVAALIFCLGLYLGWFKMSSQAGDGKSHVTLTVDKDKISQDKQTAEDKVQNLGHQAKEAVSSTGPSAGNR